MRAVKALGRLRIGAGSSEPWLLTYGPQREKPCLRGFRQSEIQTNLLSYRDQLENCNFARSKSRYHGYDTFEKANNKGADQTAQMRRLVCAFVVRKPPKAGFLASRPICDKY